MILEAIAAEEDMALPAWALPPKGKGVADHLKKQLLELLDQSRVDMGWWRRTKSKTWTSLINGLLVNDKSGAGEDCARRILAEHRKRFSKQYALD